MNSEVRREMAVGKARAATRRNRRKKENLNTITFKQNKPLNSRANGQLCLCMEGGERDQSSLEAKKLATLILP